MALILSKHITAEMAGRSIVLDYIERAIAGPALQIADPVGSTLTRSFAIFQSSEIGRCALCTGRTEPISSLLRPLGSRNAIMRVNYDREADVLHVLLVETQSDTSHEVAPGVYIETDADGRVVGVEITSASQRSGVDTSAARAA